MKTELHKGKIIVGDKEYDAYFTFPAIEFTKKTGKLLSIQFKSEWNIKLKRNQKYIRIVFDNTNSVFNLYDPEINENIIKFSRLEWVITRK